MKLEGHYTTNIKKDALWKPLLRHFRRFVRRQSILGNDKATLIEEQNVAKLDSKSVAADNENYLRDVAQCRNPEAVREFASIVMRSLGIPEELQSERHALALLLLVHSQKLTKKQELVPVMQEVMGTRCLLISQIFFQVFNENSARTRQLFFQHALMQHLWNRFVESEPKVISDFFLTLKQ